LQQQQQQSSRYNFYRSIRLNYSYGSGSTLPSLMHGCQTGSKHILNFFFGFEWFAVVIIKCASCDTVELKDTQLLVKNYELKKCP
jgi:hypothetical protein